MSVLVRAVAALLACFAVAASAKDAASGQFEIVTLSNRADLISGGDALVEVRVPKSVAPSQVAIMRGAAGAQAGTCHHCRSRVPSLFIRVAMHRSARSEVSR